MASSSSGNRGPSGKGTSSYTAFSEVDDLVSKPVLGSDGAASWQDFQKSTGKRKIGSSSGGAAPNMPLKRLDRVGTKMQSFQEERKWEDKVRKETGAAAMGEGYQHFKAKSDTPEEIAARKKAEQIKERIRPDNQRYYIAAATFEGWKFDYVFTTRQRGTGYYWDGMDSYKQHVLGQNIENTETTEPAKQTEEQPKKKKKKKKQKEGKAPTIVDDPTHPMEQIAAAIQRRNQAISQPLHLSASSSLSQQNLSLTSHANPSLTSSSENALPKGWEQATDPSSQRTYFFNRSTGERRWEKPTAAQTSSKALKAQTKTSATPNGQSSEDASKLPQGWKEAVDNGTGKKYYYHSESGKASWKRPTEDTATT